MAQHVPLSGTILRFYCGSGKKIRRLEDLPDIEVSGFRRIRQLDPGMGFSLLVYKILQNRFGIDPDEFFAQDAIQQVHVAGVDL